MPDLYHKEQNEVQPPSNELQSEEALSLHGENENIVSLVGKSPEEVIGLFGEPTRIDASAYGYDWWVYNETPETYFQIGVLDNEIVTVYAIGQNTNTSPFVIGEDYKELLNKIDVDKEVEFSHEGDFYKFELSDEDRKTRPLLKYDDVFVQLYVDDFLGTVSSIRVMNEETLIKQRPYALSYRGTLYDSAPLSDEEWSEIEAGTAQQILDITNVIRKRHHLHSLKWNDEVAKVAYGHSKDMSDDAYFSHVSPTKGDLGDRLQKGEVDFVSAGENIASQYQDGIAAVEGWLNSEGHRKALLNKEFTSLGVGVYQKFYTQNFIQTDM
ncbi:CAP domain-containing protein [Bacillus sp. CGMCC 1.16541]|uniref:CAP domain-containing protein n=1 Tax=Bacillus sp. CGMCC 1.16541 TaxID=2185143 RepID=UPI0013A5349C|nr:CAP domain-containing protein [Bacillus sp. CGMCC 1.16541]